uniref:UPAR/Ly6 domain-containing protein n=1 Tax=Xenopus tropicalis TaxID=8364 RepID=A0A803J3Q0_XENTR
MRSLLGTLCALAALAATGYSLSCQSCFAPGSAPCRGPSRPCAADSACRALYVKVTAYGVTVRESYILSCAPRIQCDRHGSINVHIVKTKTGTSCCYTDDCIPPQPTLTEDNFQLNGLSCPASISVNSVKLNVEDDLQCSGDENKCIFLTASLSGNSVTLRGCSNERMCDLKSYSFEFLEHSFYVTVMCTDKHQRWEM